MTRQLYLLRHAKSDWTTNAPNDFQRPLNDRGERNARKMGKWMAEQGIMPEVVISSPALRAWQTVTTVCHALGIEETWVTFEPNLYMADLDTLLAEVQSLPREAGSALLVGHNPGMESLLDYLTGGTIPVPPDGKLLPTATLARLELNGNWPDVAEGSASLVSLTRPKEL